MVNSWRYYFDFRIKFSWLFFFLEQVTKKVGCGFSGNNVLNFCSYNLRILQIKSKWKLLKIIVCWVAYTLFRIFFMVIWSFIIVGDFLHGRHDYSFTLGSNEYEATELGTSAGWNFGLLGIHLFLFSISIRQYYEFYITCANRMRKLLWSIWWACKRTKGLKVWFSLHNFWTKGSF